MNLTQYALMTYHTTGLGQAAADYFSRAATTGDEAPASQREAERVIDFCARVQRATPRVLPGEAGEGNDLWCEANEVALRMRRYIRGETAAANAETVDGGGPRSFIAYDPANDDAEQPAAHPTLLDAAACVVACHEGGTDQDHYELVTAMEELKQAVEAARNAPER